MKPSAIKPSAMQPPLIAHVIYRLGIGGMENGLIKLINGMPPEAYRHTIICLEDYTDLRKTIQRPDVSVIALHKKEGQDFPAYWRLWKLLRQLKPAILHTRTLGVLDAQFYGALARVPARIHGEHGRQVDDPDWKNARHRWIRKSMRPFVHRYITVSKDLESHLRDTIGVPANRVTQIYNGVDSRRFYPRSDRPRTLGPDGFLAPDSIVIGTVGRMQPVKDQVTLTRAFLRLLEMAPELHRRLRLVLVGDGALRPKCEELLRGAGVSHLAWLPGERSDADRLLPQMDIFVLPSLGEGISNTILEAMACGLPVVATEVGGNPELVEADRTGVMVPSANPDAMAKALRDYAQQPARIASHGEAGRRRIESQFTLENMISGYNRVYDTLLARTGAIQYTAAASRS